MRARLCGEVVGNNYARIYRYFGYEVCCPDDVRAAAEQCPAGEDLVFEINSGGGSAYAGFEMYSLIRAHPGRTVAEVTGIAASAASVVMAACDEVLMSPVAEVMIHRASARAAGNSEEMRKARQMLDTIDESILAAYVEKAGGKTGREQFARMMREERFMTAEQAVGCGLADGMLESPSSAEGLIPLAAASLGAATGESHGSLPPAEDLVRMAASLGIFPGGEGGTDTGAGKEAEMAGSAQAAATAAEAVPGGMAPETKARDAQAGTAAITDAAGLRAAYPEIVREIEGAASAAERERIRRIEELAPAGLEEMAAAAKFAEPRSPEAFAMAALEESKRKSAGFLAAAKRDAEASGANRVAAEPPSPRADEFLEAIRAAGKGREA